MKTIHKILHLTNLFLLGTLPLKSQTLNQQPVHETLASFKVSYKRAGLHSSGQINVVPQGTLTLHQNVNVAKIHFKIVETTGSQTEVYKVSYPLNAAIVNSQGRTKREIITKGHSIYRKC